ncbi:hypothetical protein FDP41_002844 [Naegleria fowleri]|uniref:HTH cro/C1-type domain-containing protein n=1 Tax=Naegleria fowleri TaxID=5763 RepID=A0A6A5BZC8_NAEFO|nr:uncharacterized protein FDP41_002844 [Naegleria fowleri]KAF0978329.1 hypothetical protein FDP41_002844 [Naegleria fowleri]CAG4718439.1 unnamed protein product [Naegleria fowleri]
MRRLKFSNSSTVTSQQTFKPQSSSSSGRKGRKQPFIVVSSINSSNVKYSHDDIQDRKYHNVCIHSFQSSQNSSSSRKELIQQHFKNCTQCGKCCTGYGSIRVYLNDASTLEAIAKYLNLSVEDFCKNYVMSSISPRSKDEKLLSIKYKPSLNFHKRVECVFLKQKGVDHEGKAIYQCVIYPVRPDQCRTFPHGWDEEIETDETFYNMIENCDALETLKVERGWEENDK